MSWTESGASADGPGTSPPPPPPPRAPTTASTWLPFAIGIAAALIAAAVFLVDGITPTERGPDRDRWGTHTAATIVDLDGGSYYGVYGAGFASAGPRNLRVSAEGEPLDVETVSNGRGTSRETAGRFFAVETGPHRVQVDSQVLEVTDGDGTTRRVPVSAGFSVGDDPFTSRTAVEPWPFVGVALSVVAALFLWGVGYERTQARTVRQSP
ncbi:MAG: hypothetical protein R2707_02750 [Acidimicrobiales bacterium]